MKEWTLAPEKPGYRSKTVERGGCTIIIYRPIFEREEEEQKRLQQVTVSLETAMSKYIARRQKHD